MSRFHGPAPAGKNVNALIRLFRNGRISATSPVAGQVTFPLENAKAPDAGGMYVDVHTKDHPTGEIRRPVTPLEVPE